MLYDPKHGNELIPFTELEEENSRRHFKAAGIVAPVFMNEEDAGQEDDEEQPIQRLRTTEVYRYWLDFTKIDEYGIYSPRITVYSIFLLKNSPIYIETHWAWYILGKPSKQYADLWKEFYHPRRLSQLVISNSIENRGWDFNTFCAKILNVYDDLLGAVPTRRDINALIKNDAFSVRTAVDALVEDDDSYETLFNHPVIAQLVESSHQAHNRRKTTRSRNGPPQLSRSQRGPARFASNNLDLEVLKPENQVQTHVTPFINHLASNPVFFRESLHVIGPEPKPPSAQEVIQRQKKLSNRLKDVCAAFHRSRTNLVFPRDAAVSPRSNYWKCVSINGIVFSVSPYLF